MHDFVIAEYYELWDVIEDGPFVPTNPVKDGEVTYNVPKIKKKFDDADRRKIEKKFMAKKLLVCGIGPDEYKGSLHVRLLKKFEIACKRHMTELVK